MGVMDKKTQSAKTIGEVYDRNRFEVQHRVYLDGKKGWSDWYVTSRRCKTIEAAREDRKTDVERQALLSTMVSRQRDEHRIVKVTARCEVVE